MKFDYEEFMKGNLVINCRTKEETINFFLYLNKCGIKWIGALDLLENNISEFYLHDICYRYDKGEIQEGLVHGSSYHYEELKYKIIKYNELEFDEK